MCKKKKHNRAQSLNTETFLHYPITLHTFSNITSTKKAARYMLLVRHTKRTSSLPDLSKLCPGIKVPRQVSAWSMATSPGAMPRPPGSPLKETEVRKLCLGLCLYRQCALRKLQQINHLRSCPGSTTTIQQILSSGMIPNRRDS
jgi:hypothetical protein